MRDTSLLQQALGLAPPWTVSRSDFDPEAHRLDIEIDFAPGSRFACPTCGAADCPAYDTERMTWRHLNFFQHEAYLHARVPRVRCDKCGIKTVNVPWARPGSGFTLLFEALVMTMVAAMPVKAVARIVGEHDTRLWRVIHHYVDAARARTNASGVTRLAIDETAARRGQDYVTLFVDIDQARVMFATEGNDAATIAAFADDLAAHGGDPDAITQVCIDMSPAFTKGIAENLPNAAITFDKFHAVKIINDAVDKVRRAEQEEQSLLRGTRYIWLRNPQTLSARQRKTLGGLPTRHLKTARAYQIRLAFQDLYQEPSTQAGASYLKKWYFWATHSRIEPVIAAARTVKRHRDGILQWFDSKIANGLIEGLNSLVQAAKAKARGYRSTRGPQGNHLPAGGQARHAVARVMRTFLPIPNSAEPKRLPARCAAHHQEEKERKEHSVVSGQSWWSMVRSQYGGVCEIMRGYWTVYGGTRALFSSPYAHAALVLLPFTYGIWARPNWWDVPLAVLPSLVSFTLAGYAMLMAFGNDRFKDFLRDRNGQEGPLLPMSATFAHFIFVQIFAIIAALVLKTRPLQTISELYPSMTEITFMKTRLRFYCGMVCWGAGFFMFLYSLTSVVAATLSVFRVTRWFNMFDPDQ